MNRFFRIFASFAGLALLAPTALSAHAFLDHAVPSVGATITAAPGDLELTFTQSIVVALSSVKIVASGGGAVAAAKPTSDGAKSDVIHVHLSKTLAPGTYVVMWRVVSVDTHPTSGSYKFTVAP